jgi:hypothetical protein
MLVEIELVMLMLELFDQLDELLIIVWVQEALT